MFKTPTERQGVTIAIFALAVFMLGMAIHNPDLWEVKLFEIIMQAVFLSGIIGSILALHFAANKSDETKASNTGKAFDAIKAASEAAGAPADIKRAAVEAADEVKDAAVTAAEKVADDAALASDQTDPLKGPPE